MEGQIGGKSGPGVLRTRQSGDLGALGEAWEGPEGGPGGRATQTWEVQLVLARISRPQPRAFLLNKETRKPTPTAW